MTPAPRYKVVSVTGWKIIPAHRYSTGGAIASYAVLDTHVSHRIVDLFIPDGSSSSVLCGRRAEALSDRLNLEDTQREAA